MGQLVLYLDYLLYLKKIHLLLVFYQDWEQVYKKMIPKIPKNGSYLEKKKMRSKEIKNKNIQYRD
jgi:hypothetical protein